MAEENISQQQKNLEEAENKNAEISEKKIDNKDENKEKNSAQQKWEKTSNETEKVIDGLGYHIDENIKETVTSLNIFDINTSGSCEGHIEWGTGVPWVEIADPNEPEERFINEKNVFERIAKENDVSVDDLKKEEKHEKLYRQAEEEFVKNGETKEAIAWQEENEKLQAIMEDVVSDFYKDRNVSKDVKLKFRGIGGLGRFRILSGTDEDYDRDYEKMTETEKKELGERLENYRNEIMGFSNFLKGKFFSEGENYMNAKKNKAQEKVDQDKINKIMEALEVTEAKTYVKENLKNFENVEIKKISELPYWNKMSKFLTDKKIVDREVVIVDDNEKWKSIYGSNDSKSSHEPMAIILKREIFENENISDENMSWLIHEIGHTEFYKSLGDKLDEYMEEYHIKGEYTNSEMERDAFRLQFEFLKSIGKTKAECLDFVEKYLDKSFGEDDKEAKEKELEQIKKYMNDVL